MSSIKKLTITPEMAKDLLVMNTSNRAINHAAVKKLEAELVAGNWSYNGDTIVISNNIVVDGQHRLLACANSGISFVTILVTEVDDDAFAKKDCGIKRSAGHVLGIAGIKNSKSVASVLRFIENYDTNSVAGRPSYSPSQILALVDKYDGVEEFVGSMKKFNCRGLMAESAFVGMLYIFSQLSFVEMEKFAEDVSSGANMPSSDPVMMFRDRLIKSKMTKQKMCPAECSALMIKAWNARRSGKTIGLLAWRRNGNIPEAFPKAI